jgi:O-antigen ligase
MQHNVFLAYLTETGLIGFSLLVIMLIQMARVCWKVWSDQSLDLWARQFALISLVILSCYVINGMFHDTSIIPIQHVLMFFMFGLVNNVYSNAAAFSIVAQPVKREAQRHETDGCVPSGVPAGSV